MSPEPSGFAENGEGHRGLLPPHGQAGIPPKWLRHPEIRPLDWARTQASLGVALAMLGERESGTVRLEAAVVAYHAALEKMTRKRLDILAAPEGSSCCLVL